MLSIADCLFTDGNVAAGAEPSNNIEELKQIPFELVYHDKWFDPVDRATIIYHRNAEVLLPQRLGLDAVQFICCRSQAEYETLLNLLPPGTLARWVDKIGVRPNLRLFNNRWTFVKQVEMSDKRLLFRFNKSTETPGPFDARVQIIELPTGLRYGWNDRKFQADDALNLSLYSIKSPQDYSVSLMLDKQLAFASRYREEDLPF